jgi:HD superfamily phosphohydrolase
VANQSQKTPVEGLDKPVADGRLTTADVQEIHKIIQFVHTRSSGRYRQIKFLDSSENFITFKASEAGRGRTVLITLARPSAPDSIQRLGNIRSALNAANDIRIGSEYTSYGWTDGQDYACLVSTFHENAQTLLEYVQNRDHAGATVVRLLISIAQQLESLHNAGYTHGDVSTANILVSKEEPRLIDLELCQPLESPADKLTVGGTPEFIHPQALKRVAEARTDGKAITDQERIQWDLYGLGKTFLKVLTTANPETYAELASYTQRALRLVACRCLDGLNKPADTALGLSPSDFRSLAYGHAGQVVQDLDKLLGRYDLDVQVPELDLGCPERIQANNFAPIVLTQRLRSVISTTRFAYLGRVNQLGLIQLVYPTATHTRREHALGTYAFACEYVRWLTRDEMNPFFSQVMTSVDVRALLLAALLHDLGHYPLAHDFEEADRYIFDHEGRTKHILQTNKQLRNIIEGTEPDGWAVPVERIISILGAKQESDAPIVDRLLHTIISGPVDADKLDYLTRDSMRTGTAYGGGIDVQRLSTTLTVVLRPGGRKTYAAIGTQEKGMGPAETVAFARYTMFRSVYWHHSYRAIKSMLQFIVLDRMRRAYLDDTRKYRAKLQDFLSEFMEVEFFEHSKTLFAAESLAEGSVSAASMLPYAEDSILRWCLARSSSLSRSIYGVLSSGEWYKRLAVLSYGRDLNEDTMARLTQVYSDIGSGAERDVQWIRKFLLQRVLQNNIVEKVSSLSDSERETYIPKKDDSVNRFLAACASEQVILVDFPDPERSLAGELYYLVEEDYVSKRVNATVPFDSEPSSIFRSISGDFTKSIGKLRVLVKPEHRAFLHRFLQRDSIVAALFDALDYVTSVQAPSDDELFRNFS